MKGIKKIGIHFGLIIAAFIVVIVILLMSLRSYTRHNVDYIAVPEVEGLRVDKAMQLLEEQGFEFEVNDTIYKDGVPLMSIVDQDPDSGSMVKPGRRIYLVINADKVPLVSMPALAGKESYRSALVLLRSTGLKLGRRIERQSPMINDPNSEPVLEQRIAGDSIPIKPGTKIRRNSYIDLVVGKMITSGSTDSIPEADPEMNDMDTDAY